MSRCPEGVYDGTWFENAVVFRTPEGEFFGYPTAVQIEPVACKVTVANKKIQVRVGNTPPEEALWAIRSRGMLFHAIDEKTGCLTWTRHASHAALLSRAEAHQVRDSLQVIDQWMFGGASFVRTDLFELGIVWKQR